MISCDRRTAERLLGESLCIEETAQFEEHVAICTKCQDMLVDAAGGAETLNMATAMFSSSTELPQWTDNHKSLFDSRSINHAPSSDVIELSILGPTDDPASMGRIGNYEIQGIIGRGGMGIVFRAVDSALRRNVALKVLDPALATIGAARKRFAMEARAMAAISHEHVVPVYTVDDHRNLPYFAMEYIPGGTLESRIRTHGPLDVLSVLQIARQVALALSAAHECGLVHRDIKPANILLDRGVERVRVADFGLARVNSDASYTRSGFVAGTPQFMAPEQVRGESCTEQSDLFSLGTVMYAMCTGHSPFRSESIYGSMQRIVHDQPRSICDHVSVPKWLEQFIFKLLSKIQSDRFADAMSVAALLEQEISHLQNPSQNAQPARVDYGLADASKRTQWKLIVATTMLSLVVCYTAWVLLPPKEANEKGDNHSKDITTTPLWSNDGTDSYRERALTLERSFFGSDVLPSSDTFERELQILKQNLNTFENQTP